MLHNKNVMLSSILTFGYKKAPDAVSIEGLLCLFLEIYLKW